MNFKRAFAYIVSAFLLFFSQGCSEHSTENLKLATTTSLIGSMAQTVGEDKVEVMIVVPGEMCPGHFDISPRRIKSIKDARLLLTHGWEKWVDDLTGSREHPVKKELGIKGNLMVPKNHIKAVEKLTGILSRTDKENRSFYETNSDRYVEKIQKFKKEIENSFTDPESVNVICSKLQKEFIASLGFNIVATYDRPENISPKELSRLTEKIKESNVRLIIDNLQSGTEIGKQLSRETGINRVTLSNFPLNNSYLSTLESNIKKLRKILDG